MASEEVEWARSTVAETIGADPREIVWTNGATESVNWLFGFVRGDVQATGRNKIITMETEHKAVLDTCAHLRGAEVIYLKPKLMVNCASIR